MSNLNLDLIQDAIAFLQGKVVETPIEYSPSLTEILGTPVYLKLESLQVTGSFKVRGALYYLSTLKEAERERGVAACSAGNHGLGVAYAAKKIGASCTVYVPKNVDEVKKKKIIQLGAVVQESEFTGYDDTLKWAKQEVSKTGQHFITAYEDERIMASNGGTIGAEILKDMPDVENVLFPIGGGGLGAGLSYYLKSQNPSIRLIGCQHIESPALKLSLERRQAVTTLPAIETIAGGLEGGIGQRCFDVLKDRITEVSLLSEREIWEACAWMLETHQHLIEPSGVVPIASCLAKRLPKLSGKTVVILSGRNVSFSTLQKVLSMR